MVRIHPPQSCKCALNSSLNEKRLAKDAGRFLLELARYDFAIPHRAVEVT